MNYTYSESELGSVFSMRKDAAKSEVRVLIELARKGPLSWSELRHAAGLSPDALKRALDVLEGPYVCQDPINRKWAILSTRGLEYLRLLERNRRKRRRLEGDDQKRLNAYRQLSRELQFDPSLSAAKTPTYLPVRDLARADSGAVLIDPDRTVTRSGVAVIRDTNRGDTLNELDATRLAQGWVPPGVTKYEVYYGVDVKAKGPIAKHPGTRCSNCKGTNLYFDSERGETVCRDCGTVNN